MGESTKYYLVDASFVLSYLLPDEHNEEVSTLFLLFAQQKVRFLSSPLLPLEVLNTLKVAILRGRVTKAIAKELAAVFKSYEIRTLSIENYSAVFELAIEKDITVYDASYLHLALVNNLPLLTLDDNLKKLAS